MIQVKPNELLLIYNSNKMQDREAFGYFSSLTNLRIKDLDVQNDPLTMQQLAGIAMQMNKNPQALINPRAIHVGKSKKRGAFSDDEDILKYLKNNPDALRTPIIITSDQAYFVDSPFDFVKENMAVKSAGKKYLPH
jgi:arsenate reductase-like glutaredoxin family protein